MLSAFVQPSLPVLKDEPPSGLGWIHEIKLDGFRVQVHTGPKPIIFSRNGLDLSNRFDSLVRSMSKLKPAIIDAEIVALDTCGRPDFRALMGGSRQLCIYGFDLLYMDDDLRALRLKTRRNKLRRFLKAGAPILLSDDFPDPVQLLEVADRMRLEGIVSKKLDQPYRSGKNPGWVKVKTHSWREANIDRGEMFNSPRF